MENEILKKFAEELKAARELKDIPLQQIFNKTRIDIKFLQAIEDANYKIMPEVYIRAFIKEYAKAVDLDPEATLKKFEIAKAGRVFDENEVEQFEDSENRPIQREFSAASHSSVSEAPSSNMNQYLMYGIYSAAGVIALVIVYFLFIHSPETEIITERPYEEVFKENQKRFEVDESKEEKVPAIVAARDSLALTIVASDTCWVGVNIDETFNTDFIMFPGRRKTLKGTSLFDIVVGNAGGIEFYLNNNKLEFAGTPGARRNIKINSTGIIVN